MVILVGKKYKIYVEKYYYKATKAQQTKKDKVCGNDVINETNEVTIGYFPSLLSALKEIATDGKEQGNKINDVVLKAETIYSSIVKAKHQNIKSKMQQKSIQINIDGEYFLEIDERQFCLTRVQETKKRNPTEGDGVGEKQVDIGFHNDLQRTASKIIHCKLNEVDSEISIEELLPMIEKHAREYSSILKLKIKEALAV